MDERRLRYFLAVVDEGTVTQAAEKLHLAQPSLSQTLRALERELDVELFHRVGRGLHLSAAGHALIGPARQALIVMDTARAAVREVSELRAGTLPVAALATLAVDPLAELIGLFRTRYPGVSVLVYEPDSTDGLGTLIGEGQCELGFAHLPLHREDLLTSELGGQELLFVLPPDSHATGASVLSPSTLRAVPLVVSPPGTSTRILLEQALTAVGVTPRIAVETQAREAIIPLVLAGAGAALLPASLAREAERRGAIVRAAKPRITRRVGLVHRDGPLSPAARAFAQLAIESAEARGNGERPSEQVT